MTEKMQAEVRKEMCEQLAAVSAARMELLKIAEWLDCYNDVRGCDPYIRPTDLAYYIRRAGEQLSFAVGMLMAFVCPTGILGGLAAKNAESAKEGE